MNLFMVKAQKLFGVADGSFQGAKQISVWCLAGLTTLNLNHDLAYFVGILLALDFLLALVKAIMLRNIQFGAAWKGIVKTMIYLAVILLAAVVSKCVGGVEFLVNIVVSYVLVTEAISILETLQDISFFMGLKIPILEALLKFLSEKREGLLTLKEQKDLKKTGATTPEVPPVTESPSTPAEPESPEGPDNTPA